jgi:protein-L-isoaspartate O-methyltransferase
VGQRQRGDRGLQETLYTSRNPTRRWLHNTRRDWVVAALRRAAAAGRPERALEIGPGAGTYLPVLAELAGTIVASDVEADFLDNAGPWQRICPAWGWCMTTSPRAPSPLPPST